MDLPKDILDLVAVIPDLPGASVSFTPNEGIRITLSKERLNVEFRDWDDVEFRDWDVVFAIREGKLEPLSPQPTELELTKGELEHFLVKGEFEHFLVKLELIKFFLDNKKSASEILGLAIYRG